MGKTSKPTRTKTGGNLPAPESPRVRQAERATLGPVAPRGGSGYRTRDGRAVRVGLAVEEDLLDRLRAAAVDRNETLAGIVNRALKRELERLETEHGKPYKRRDPKPRGSAIAT